MGRKRKSKSGKNISSLVFNVLKDNKTKAFNYKQIASIIDVKDSSGRNQIIKALHRLKIRKEAEEVEVGKFKFVFNSSYHTGILDLSSRGSGYIICEDFEDDIYIAQNNINKAFNKDEVEFYVYKRRRNGRLEGEITKIVKRDKTEFVGVIQISEKFAFVVVDNRKLSKDLFIPKDKINGAKNGDKVLVEFEKWPDRADSPYGKILKVLGIPGEHNTEIHSILSTYGLPYEFPIEVQDYANQLDTSISSEEISKRKDLRDILTFTIDPKDAKDFDDALSFRVLDNGNYEVGIHIADVSHYLQPGTVLDEEAFERATSVYLVDRVVPMLPEVLSNKACSLRPNEEKYTFSAIFTLDDTAKVVNQWFGRTVIYSDARFAYEEAQHIIETHKNKIPEEISIREEGAYVVDDSIKEAILKLDSLAKFLRSKRMSKGALSFDKVEVKFNLDEEANPVGVFFKTSKDANKLIEEFMLLANKKVAEFIGKRDPKHTFVYRVHDEPDESKLAQLQTVVSRFGYKLNFQDKNTITSSLNNLLKDVEGKKEQNLVDTLTIRSMSKAEYTTHNIGHYGLAFDYYSHFTSPIRRYPDVVAHRLLQHYLDEGKSVSEELHDEQMKHCSDMEALAAKAERDSIKYMQIKFMQDHKDEEFLGVISGVTEWGIYVEIVSNKCEGMIRIRDIKEDYYEFDESLYAIVGRDSKFVYQLGDEVIVKVKNTDLANRHLDFSLIGPNN